MPMSTSFSPTMKDLEDFWLLKKLKYEESYNVKRIRERFDWSVSNRSNIRDETNVFLYLLNARKYFQTILNKKKYLWPPSQFPPSQVNI